MTVLAADAPRARFRRVDRVAWPSLGLLVFVALCIVLRGQMPWLLLFPKSWILPLAAWANVISDAVAGVLQPLCRNIAALLEMPMRGMRAVLQWLPWPIAIVLVAAVALRASGWRLAVFAAVALAYMVAAGYWRQSMNTMAILVLAVPGSVIAGFAIGVLAERWPLARRPIERLLDLMQTVPAFAYLIPLLLLFGFGPAVGLIASAIYAIPPMVRNTMLGLRLVAPEIREAGTMVGCTRRQKFWQVEVPSAMPQLLVGVNQTTMAALSMVIIGAIIGGFEDIGWEVLSAMRKAEFGQSLLSGLVIALLAILIDRITLGFARLHMDGSPNVSSRFSGRYFWGFILAALIAALLIRLSGSAGADALPLGRVFFNVAVLNDTLLAFVRDHADALETIKNTTLYCLMLPLRIGIAGAATPAIWGVTLTPLMTVLYSAIVLLAAAMLGLRFTLQAGIAVILAGVILYYGFTGLPWPALIAMVGVLAYGAGGWRTASFAVCGLGFILVTGNWLALMQSIYLCALAVMLCMLIGGALGVWAATSDRVSRVLRPINDALQTMPQFVFLIPALMFFKVGEFSALIAIMLYAVVPPIRYVEHGLRNVAPDVVEAARQMGATPRQLLWRVKIPLALPVLMLGLNQTIMAALSMLVIAAMVGTRDLGQQVYVALGKADAGMGLIAGLSIALVAMISDRIIQNWFARLAG
ncbi:ABC transporter permease subunit [soil metagenome]